MQEHEIEEFISLRRLNRHLVVVIDSDKTSAHKEVGPDEETSRRGVR
jgi:hypothetical protein